MKNRVIFYLKKSIIFLYNFLIFFAPNQSTNAKCSYLHLDEILFGLVYFVYLSYSSTYSRTLGDFSLTLTMYQSFNADNIKKKYNHIRITKILSRGLA